MEFSRNKAKQRHKKLPHLEVKLNEFEQNLSNDEGKEQYNVYRGKINKICDEISNDIKIRSKCDFYEFGEKSKKKILTKEKRQVTQNIVRKVLLNDLSKIDTHIYQSYQNLYMEKKNISEDSICNFLNDPTVPSLTVEQSPS